VRSASATRDARRDAVAWAREAAERGAGELLVTSIDRDGTQSGYDLALTRAVSDAVGVPVIASGGAGSADDVAEILTGGGAAAALLASLLHFGIVSIPTLKAELAQRGIAVRDIGPAPSAQEVAAWLG
jgi:cyclase